MIKLKVLIAFVYSLFFFFLINPVQQFILFVMGLILGLALLVIDQKILSQHYPESKLITRSSLFIISLVPLAFFAVSSTSSTLATGLVFGVMLGIIQEMWQFRNNPVLLQASSDDYDSLVIGFTVIFVIMNFLFLV